MPVAKHYAGLFSKRSKSQHHDFFVGISIDTEVYGKLNTMHFCEPRNRSFRLDIPEFPCAMTIGMDAYRSEVDLNYLA